MDGGVESTTPSSPLGTTSAVEVVLSAVDDGEPGEEVADGLGVVADGSIDAELMVDDPVFVVLLGAARSTAGPRIATTTPMPIRPPMRANSQSLR